MARPVKIDGTDGVIEVSDDDLNWVADTILLEFATNQGVGSLQVGGSAGSLTNIGSFTNTQRNDAVGVHPTNGNTNTTTTIIYQDRTTADETSMVRPLEIDGTSGLIESSNDSLNNTIINTAMSRLIVDGIGTYFLSTNASEAGSTQRGSFSDSIVGGGTQQTYYIHQRTTATSLTGDRPLKIDTTAGVVEMTDANLESLVARFRNRIVETGIGYYAFQANAPGTGSWTQEGVQANDTRRQVGNRTYSGTYSRNFTRFFNGRNAGTFTGFFTGNYVGATVLSSTETASTFRLWRRNS